MSCQISPSSLNTVYLSVVNAQTNGQSDLPMVRQSHILRLVSFWEVVRAVWTEPFVIGSVQTGPPIVTISDE